MACMRAFELALGDLWAQGLISGELHLGIGEEGIVAGVVDHLTDGDALALSALLNEAVMIPALSGGRWPIPLVVRAVCGGGYGDAGQHEQSLWGLLAGIPGLQVVVPSNPADAAGLMLSAIRSDDPVVFLEHKLLSDLMRASLAGDRRTNIVLDVPSEGAEGEVRRRPEPVPIGSGKVVRGGNDLTIFSLAIGVHRSLEAAGVLAEEGIETTVVDLRTVAPLDRDLITTTATATGKVLVVDEDYETFGLSGEIAAVVAESGVDASFRRMATTTQIPYVRHLQDAVLPNVNRIVASALSFS